MPLPGTTLGAPEHQFVNDDAHRHASTAIIAVRTIGKGATAAKAGLYQFAVDAGIDQVAGRRHLGPRQLLRQIAARIRCGSVKLQHGRRKIIQLTHGRNTISRLVRDSLPILSIFH